MYVNVYVFAKRMRVCVSCVPSMCVMHVFVHLREHFYICIICLYQTDFMLQFVYMQCVYEVLYVFLGWTIIDNTHVFLVF